VILGKHYVTDYIEFECKLKTGKRDGRYGFDSDHVVNGSENIFQMIHFLFITTTVRRYTATGLLYFTIISIPKNVRSFVCSRDNYRGKALRC